MGETPALTRLFSKSSARRQQANVIPGDRRRGKRGNLGDVVRWRDLDDIHPDEVQPGEPAQDGPRLPGREPSHFGCSGSRCKSRVERVDVEAEIGGPVAEHGSGAL